MPSNSTIRLFCLFLNINKIFTDHVKKPCNREWVGPTENGTHQSMMLQTHQKSKNNQIICFEDQLLFVSHQKMIHDGTWYILGSIEIN